MFASKARWQPALPAGIDGLSSLAENSEASKDAAWMAVPVSRVKGTRDQARGGVVSGGLQDAAWSVHGGDAFAFLSSVSASTEKPKRRSKGIKRNVSFTDSVPETVAVSTILCQTPRRLQASLGLQQPPEGATDEATWLIYCDEASERVGFELDEQGVVRIVDGPDAAFAVSPARLRNSSNGDLAALFAAVPAERSHPGREQRSAHKPAAHACAPRVGTVGRGAAARQPPGGRPHPRRQRQAGGGPGGRAPAGRRRRPPSRRTAARRPPGTIRRLVPLLRTPECRPSSFEARRGLSSPPRAAPKSLCCRFPPTRSSARSPTAAPSSTSTWRGRRRPSATAAPARSPR